MDSVTCVRKELNFWMYFCALEIDYDFALFFYILEQLLCWYSDLTLHGNPVIGNSLKPNGHFMYRQVQHPQILRSAHTLFLRVLNGSEKKQRLFPMGQ